jgi:hypothetical protein
VLDAVRLGPDDDETEVTAAQVREVVTRLIAAGHWREHTFRLFKQVLGWTVPKIRDPQASDRWTWLIIAAHTGLPRPPAGH